MPRHQQFSSLLCSGTVTISFLLYNVVAFNVLTKTSLRKCISRGSNDTFSCDKKLVVTISVGSGSQTSDFIETIEHTVGGIVDDDDHHSKLRLSADEMKMRIRVIHH